MFWNKQNPWEPLELIFYYNNKGIENKTVSNHFSTEFPDSSQIYLCMDFLQPYKTQPCIFVPAAKTALQSQFFPVHNPWVFQEVVGQLFPVRITKKSQTRILPAKVPPPPHMTIELLSPHESLELIDYSGIT